MGAGYSASAIITLGFWNAEHDKSAIANKLIDHTAECLRCAHDASSKGGNENGQPGRVQFLSVSREPPYIDEQDRSLLAAALTPSGQIVLPHQRRNLGR